MKKYLAFVVIFAVMSSPVIQADQGDTVLQIHNAYVKHLMEAPTKKSKCALMFENMHPDPINLAVSYEYAGFIFSEVAEISEKEYKKTSKFPGGNVLLAPLKSNNYVSLSVPEKFTAFCGSENSRTFNLEKFKGYITAQKVVRESDSEVVLEAVSESNKNQKYYYFWKKDAKGKWKFFNGSFSANPYPEINEDGREMIITVLAKMNGAEIAFDECFKVKNNVFNVEDVKRMLTIIYNKSFDDIIGNKKSVLKSAEDETVAKYKQAITQPKACDSDLARGQSLSAVINQLQQIISQVTRLSMK